MKKSTSILLTAIFALLISVASGLSPFVTVPGLFIIGALSNPAPIRGVLLDITAVSAFAGTNVTNILSLLVLGAETIQKGLLHTIPNKYDVIYMPKLDTAANQLQARVDTPTISADSEYSERVIDPKDLMYYMEFNPATFESVWSEFWPKSSMVNQIQDPKIMAAVTKTVAGSINTQLENNIWQGDDDGGVTPNGFFDGFLKTMAGDGDTIKYNIVAAIDETNIKEVLDGMITAMLPAVRINKNPKFAVSHATFDAFEQYTTALDFKGNSVYDGTQLRYRGYQIVPVGGMTDNNIVFADMTTGPEGNLFAGTWLENDRNNFKIERLQNNSELFFLKALFRYGVNYGKSQEIVLGTHTPA